MLPIVLMFATFQPQPAPASRERASQLYEQCRATIRIQDGSAKGGDSAYSNACIAYIDGFIDGMEIAGLHIICPHGAAFGTLARVYVVYLEAHPKEMDSWKPEALASSLVPSYPCPTANTPKK